LTVKQQDLGAVFEKALPEHANLGSNDLEIANLGDTEFLKHLLQTSDKSHPIFFLVACTVAKCYED
jgi:hypothetical protein